MVQNVITTRYLLEKWYADKRNNPGEKQHFKALTYANIADEIRALNRQGQSFVTPEHATLTNDVAGFANILRSTKNVEVSGELLPKTFVSDADITAFEQLSTGINAYVRVRADIFGAGDSPIPETVLDDLITASQVPLSKGLKPVSEVMSKQLQLFEDAWKLAQNNKPPPNKAKGSASLQPNKHVEQQKMTLAAIAEGVSIPANDIGFMAAVAALTEFGVTPQEAETLEKWLTNTKYNLFPKGEAKDLVQFVAEYTQGSGLRSDPAVVKDSVLGKLLDKRPKPAKEKPNTGPGSPGFDHFGALNYLGDKDGVYVRDPERDSKGRPLWKTGEKHPETSLQALARKEVGPLDKLSSWIKGPEGRGTKKDPNDNGVVGAVLNDLGELIRIKDTIHPKALSERLTPDKVAELDTKIDEELPKLTPPQGLDAVCQPVWRLKKLEKKIAAEIKAKMVEKIPEKETAKLVQRSNDVYALLAKGMRVQERIAIEMKPVVEQISQEMYDHEQVRKWLNHKAGGEDIQGTDVVALRHLFTETIPPYYTENKASAEALAAAQEIRRVAVSFWAENRTENLSYFKKIKPRKKPSAGWSAAVNHPEDRAEVRAAVMRILAEDCRITFPEGFDPKNYPENHPFLSEDLDKNISSLEFLQLASMLEYEYGLKIRSMEQGKTYLRNINTIVETLAPKGQPTASTGNTTEASPSTKTPTRRPWS